MNFGLPIFLMAHSHCAETGTGLGQEPGTGLGHNVHNAQGLGLGTRPGNIMHATEIHYKVPLGNISGTEKWVGKPLYIFLVPFPVPVQCEQFCIIYSNTLLPVLVPFPFLVPVPCNVNAPLVMSQPKPTSKLVFLNTSSELDSSWTIRMEVKIFQKGCLQYPFCNRIVMGALWSPWLAKAVYM